ncbi:MAG: hypothetical protein ACREYF_16725 [Gammaproteobacteria bacterium]
MSLFLIAAPEFLGLLRTIALPEPVIHTKKHILDGCGGVLPPAPAYQLIL